ncbi:MAG: hypothetical protein KF898_08610 [Parachlamydiales bacterium]|nr:hypothetical protein [Verrucomicrobiota bacterium]MBX3719694.1 hypothetical protein [Candidatus Acheromyda pituitae]
MSYLSPVQQMSASFIASPINIRYAAHTQTVAHSRAWQLISDFGQAFAHAVEQIYQFIANLFFKIGEFFHNLFYKSPSSAEIPPSYLPDYELPAPLPSPSSQPISSPISTDAVLFETSRPIVINLNGLARVPRVISQEEIEQDLRAAEAQVADLNELTAICHATSPEVEPRIRNFIHFAATGGNSEYFLTLRSYFKGIIVEMRKESIPVELKQQALQNLANGYYGCNAIRFNSVEREYKRLSQRLPTPEDKILEALQQYKEQIFIAHYHLRSNPSFLNHIRREVGVELGLDRHEIYINDPQIENGPRGAPDEYRNVFRNAFTHAGILNSMHRAFNDLFRSPDYGRDLGSYINHRLDELEARGLINHQRREDLGDELMPWGFEISESGVKFLLLQVGIFAHG